MATCPRCFGALTENHRCSKGRFSRAAEVVATLGAGGIAGMFVCYAVEGQPAGFLVLSASALGAVLAYAARQALAPHL